MEKEDVSQHETDGSCKIIQINTDDIPPRNAHQKVLTEWCVKNILAIKVKLSEYDNIYEKKPTKPSWKSPWVWLFGLVVVGIISYLIFIMYMQTKGYNIKLPSFLK